MKKKTFKKNYLKTKLWREKKIAPETIIENQMKSMYMVDGYLWKKQHT